MSYNVSKHNTIDQFVDEQFQVEEPTFANAVSGTTLGEQQRYAPYVNKSY